MTISDAKSQLLVRLAILSKEFRGHKEQGDFYECTLIRNEALTTVDIAWKLHIIDGLEAFNRKTAINRYWRAK